MRIDVTGQPVPDQTPEQAERLRQIAEKQGTLGKSRLENLLGKGKDLWETEEEFEQFLRFLRESRERG